MRLKNNIFAAAFDYLKREQGVKTQKHLAELMGVSEDTISRILKDRTEVTEDIITKLQTASGCVFNLQWLRGEDPLHMLASDVNDGMKVTFNYGESQPIDHSSLVNAALAAKDETIAEFRERILDLQGRIKDKEDVIQTKDALIVSLRQQLESASQIRTTKPYPLSSDERLPIAAENR